MLSSVVENVYGITIYNSARCSITGVWQGWWAHPAVHQIICNLLRYLSNNNNNKSQGWKSHLKSFLGIIFESINLWLLLFYCFTYYFFCKSSFCSPLEILNVLPREQEVSFQCELSGFVVKIGSCFFQNETRQACKREKKRRCVNRVPGDKSVLIPLTVRLLEQMWPIKYGLFTLEHGQSWTMVVGCC